MLVCVAFIDKVMCYENKMLQDETILETKLVLFWKQTKHY